MSEPQIGDTFRIKQETIKDIENAFCLNDGKPITTESIFKIHRIIEIGSYTSVYFDGVTYLDGTPNTLPLNLDDIILCKDETKTNKIEGCTCDNFDLFNIGCKCGWIQIERKLNV